MLARIKRGHTLYIIDSSDLFRSLQFFFVPKAFRYSLALAENGMNRKKIRKAQGDLQARARNYGIQRGISFHKLDTTFGLPDWE